MDAGGVTWASTVDVGIVMLLLLLLITIAPAAPASAVPFCCMAICMNNSWLLSAVGLMLKVMPFPQWLVGFFCLQYHPYVC